MRAWMGAAVVGVLTIAEPAAAEEQLLLNFRAPMSCPAGSDFRGAVHGLLKDPGSAPRQVPVHIVIEPTEDGGYTLDLNLPNGSRQIDGAACEDVVQAAALFVALALEDPEFQAAPPEPESEEDPGPPPPEPPVSDTHLFFGVSGGIDTGTLPQPGPIASFHLGYLSDSLLIEGRVFGSPPQKTKINNARTLDTALFGGAMHGCHVPARFKLGFFTLCAGVSGGALFASSPEILAAGEAAPAFFNADLGSGFWWLIEEGFAVSLGAELSQPLLAPAIYLRGGDEPELAHKAGTTFRGLAGMRLIF